MLDIYIKKTDFVSSKVRFATLHHVSIYSLYFMDIFLYHILIESSEITTPAQTKQNKQNISFCAFGFHN